MAVRTEETDVREPGVEVIAILMVHMKGNRHSVPGVADPASGADIRNSGFDHRPTQLVWFDTGAAGLSNDEDVLPFQAVERSSATLVSLAGEVSGVDAFPFEPAT